MVLKLVVVLVVMLFVTTLLRVAGPPVLLPFIPVLPLALIGGALVQPKIQALRRRTDWREFGGALLLGVNGVVVIAHGRSDARAIVSAIRVARDAVRNEVVATIASAMSRRVTSPVPSSTEGPSRDVT